MPSLLLELASPEGYAWWFERTAIERPSVELLHGHGAGVDDIAAAGASVVVALGLRLDLACHGDPTVRTCCAPSAAAPQVVDASTQRRRRRRRSRGSERDKAAAPGMKTTAVACRGECVPIAGSAECCRSSCPPDGKNATTAEGDTEID